MKTIVKQFIVIRVKLYFTSVSLNIISNSNGELFKVWSDKIYYLKNLISVYSNNISKQQYIKPVYNLKINYKAILLSTVDSLGQILRNGNWTKNLIDYINS